MENTDIDLTGESYEPRENDKVIDYSEAIAEMAFVGEFPFDVILDGIREQFINYIGTDDNNNYVDSFFNQLYDSYEIVREDEEEEHKDEIINTLNNYYDVFISKISKLFNDRLDISLRVIEEGDSDEVKEYVIRKLYNFFIIDARKNFKLAISRAIGSSIEPVDDNREYIKNVKSMLQNFSPLVTAFGPIEFIRIIGNNDVLDIFNNSYAVGNFLKKYSPKLYDNEDFEVEIIDDITMMVQEKGGNI